MENLIVNYFKVEKEHLETVKSICYLGITINCSETSHDTGVT